MAKGSKFGRALAIFRKMAIRDKLIVLEAVALVHLASLAIRFVSFRRIAKWASLPQDGRRFGDDCADSARANRVGWAVSIARRNAVLRAKCFEGGLAAHLMLRRRNLNSVLYYGAAPGRKKALDAHVWVECDGRGISGHDVDQQFAVLARFPE